MPAVDSRLPALPDSSRVFTTKLLRRFFPVYCVLAAAVTFGYALYDRFQIDGDAIAYMDIGDYLRTHQWSAVVNGYWHPMYPGLLALGHGIFRATLASELRACYFVNFCIFLLQMLAVVWFSDSLLRLRASMGAGALESGPAASASGSRYLLDRYALRYLGLALIVIASQRELSMGKVRPDALLQTLLLVALSALLTHLATGQIRYAAALGLALGCAYLTKSFAFVFAFLCVGALVAFRRIWLRHSAARILSAVAVAVACFGMLAGAYVTALSRQHGRLDFGDSGGLNYAWYVAGTEKMHLQPYMTSRFGSAQVHLKHPERELLRSPQVLSYAEHAYGTNPDWFDPTYWNDQVKPRFAVRGEISRASRNCVLVLRYLLNHPEALILLALLMAVGARPSLSWRRSGNAFWLVPVLLGLLVWGIYAIVNTEERYVTVAYIMIMLSLFGALSVGEARHEREPQMAHFAPLLILLVALLATGESLRTVLEDRRQLAVLGLSRGWQDPNESNAAAALTSMGVKPGEPVACVGYNACLGDFYWARLAGVRILSEIYNPDASTAYQFLSQLPNREQAINAVRSTGAKVLVADFSGAPVGASPAMRGWQQLGDSTLYELPLNVPPGTIPHPPPPAPPRKPSF